MKATVKEIILAITKKWRTYEQLEDAVKPYTESTHETIGRNIRWLVEDKKLEKKIRKVNLGGKVKSFVMFRKV